MKRAAVLAVALVAGHTWAACPWADPGADPYRGTPSAAINRMADIPAPVRAELVELRGMGAGVPVRVTRDAILGMDGAARFTNLRDMNFGDGAVCRGAVDRSMWPEGHIELATAYSAQGYVVLHFRRCQNIARATDPKVSTTAGELGACTIRAWRSVRVRCRS